MKKPTTVINLSPPFQPLTSEAIVVSEQTKRHVLEDEAPLSDEQQAVVDSVLDGKNVFITGSAGTGKSLVLKYIRHHLELQKKRYAITAPTGAAAILIGGQTIHSWAKIGTGEKPLRMLVEEMKTHRRTYEDIKARDPVEFKKNWQIREALRPWTITDVLIVDEVSMVSTEHSQSYGSLLM